VGADAKKTPPTKHCKQTNPPPKKKKGIIKPLLKLISLSLSSRPFLHIHTVTIASDFLIYCGL
jgi:hypothetical protein